MTRLELLAEGGVPQVQATLRSDTLDRPFALWFRFPVEMEPWLDLGRGDFLVAALLLPAMRFGETLELSMAISPQLARAVPRIQSIYRAWDPRLSAVRVEAPPRESPAAVAREVGLFFSSGVDSSYLLTRNLLEHPLNEDAITELLTVQGIDLRVGDPRHHYEAMLVGARRIADRLGKRVLGVATNIQELARLACIPWGTHGHGAALASVGLLLGRRFRRIYVAPAGSYRKLLPSGCHPLLDPLWSTESLGFVHDGCEATRLERIRLLVEHPVALDALRVCWDRESPAYNCGRCSKCLLAMVGLHINGALDRCPTLPSSIDVGALRGLQLVMAPELDWTAELIDALGDGPADAEMREALEGALSRAKTYFDRLDAATRTILRVIPGGDRFILVDEEAIREKLGACIPFMERAGEFYGNPPDDASAIRELERLRAAGAGFIAFWWGCFWYLDYYSGFAEYLRSRYRCACENESVVVFDLRHPVATE